MKYKSFVVALVLASAVQSAARAQGFPWHLYEPHTLGGVAREHAEDASGLKSKGQIVFTKGRPYRVGVTYTGTSRPLPAKRKELIKLWVEAYGIDPKFIGLYENEFLFTEDSVDYWLPVQTPVSKYFGKELRKGDRVELYVQFVGGVRDKESARPDWIFLVNEFQKPPPDA